MSKLINLVGQKFGKLIVIKREGSNKHGQPFWLCECECGNKRIVLGVNLRRGSTRSCGCLMGGFIDLTGQRFGRLVVIKIVDRNKWKRIRWLCRCNCGKEKIIDGASLRGGWTKSCGCLLEESRKLPSGLASMRVNIRGYKHNAKKRGYEYKLTEEQFREITQKRCFYCNAKPINIYNGIDRIDNSKGYTINNVVSCCFKCNRAKDIYTQKEFREWIKEVYTNLYK